MKQNFYSREADIAYVTFPIVWNCSYKIRIRKSDSKLWKHYLEVLYITKLGWTHELDVWEIALNSFK